MNRDDLPRIDEIIIEIEKLSNGGLHQKDDLTNLISTAINEELVAELEELAFHSKYLIGLTKVLQKNDVNVNEEYFEKLKSEFQSGYDSVRKNLTVIINRSSNFIRQIFEEKYLQLTHSCLTNLNQLCADLSLLKLYLNDLKTKKGSQ